MRAELRSLDYFQDDLRAFEGAAFCITVTATIGAVGLQGGDNFSFEVCSPEWLQVALVSEVAVSGQFRIIMTRFDHAALERLVSERVRQAEGPDWPSVAAKLSAWSHWEFEEFRPS